MLKNIYNQIKVNHAGAVMRAVAKIPGVALGVGDGEIMRSIGTGFRPVPTVQAATVPQIKNMDQTLYVGNGPQVNQAQFPKSWYMGEDGGDYGV